MGIHCLFILTTLSLPSGWVRLVNLFAKENEDQEDEEEQEQEQEEQEQDEEEEEDYFEEVRCTA